MAIGDIHGCSMALDCLLASFGPRKNDLVITLGDYVDRGPDSRGVIDRLIDLRKRCQLVCLRGNHEQIMIAARLGKDRLTEWRHSGGDKTLASYAHNGDGGGLADVPDHHWDFLQTTCVDSYETDTHIFTHASIDPDLPLDQQPEWLLRWERFSDPRPHVSGKVMVCGHTSQKSGAPCDLGHAICIDTNVCRQGWLTCFEVMTGYVWQSTQAGDLRTGWLKDYASAVPMPLW